MRNCLLRFSSIITSSSEALPNGDKSNEKIFITFSVFGMPYANDGLQMCIRDRIIPLIAREKDVIRNFFLLREVFIFAIEKGVIFLNRCFGVLQFCKTPFVLYASIGDTWLAILAGLLMEYRMATYSNKRIKLPQDVYKRQI